MGGGWVGYVFALLGCGTLVAALAGATALLYGWAKIQRGRGLEVKARVTSLSSRDDEPGRS